MPGGGRKTHDYPYGKPLPSVLVNIAMVVVGILWVTFGYPNWGRAAGILAVFVLLGFIDYKLHQAYERTGEAVPIARPVTVIKFVDGAPAPLLALRCAFFVFVAVLVVFGIAPLKDAIAKNGMMWSVIGLFGTGIVHFALERYYVYTGRAKEVPRVDLPNSTTASKATKH